MKISYLVITALFFFSTAHAAINVPLTVTEGTSKYVGTLYLPEHHSGKIPLVLVIPEWWGKNAYVDKRAQMVADELGAAALSVDVYGNGVVAQTPAEAMKSAGPFYKNPEMGVTRLNAFLQAVPAVAKAAKADVDMQKIVAIGFCFGGTQALNLMRSGQVPAGDKLVGVASFHGGLASSLKATHPIDFPILVMHGEADQMVKPAEVAAFKSEMAADKVKLKFVSYPGAQHAYSNPESTANGKKFNMPISYNEAADKGSWAEFKKYFAQVTK